MSDHILESTRTIGKLNVLLDALRDVARSIEIARQDLIGLSQTEAERRGVARIVCEDAGSLRDRFLRLTALYNDVDAFIDRLARRAADTIITLNTLSLLREGRGMGTADIRTAIQNLDVGHRASRMEEEEEDGEGSGDETQSENDSAGSKKRTREPDSPEARIEEGSKKAKGQGSFRLNPEMLKTTRMTPERIASTSSGITRGEAFTSVSSASARQTQGLTQSDGHASASTATPSSERVSDAYTNDGFFKYNV
ncbi:hypothetical protein BDN72DRAFT_905403 [Pluteus cervinus]|uniref:Uncharacterized protein n=1 Tax=Pluteus cervinus TaxID=181527 RepID=A0ACD3A310_9AGAR|nr:hypothetical protein BDN72DRAFT_905403 [Pluteus cervinus]